MRLRLYSIRPCVHIRVPSTVNSMYAQPNCAYNAGRSLARYILADTSYTSCAPTNTIVGTIVVVVPYICVCMWCVSGVLTTRGCPTVGGPPRVWGCCVNLLIDCLRVVNFCTRVVSHNNGIVWLPPLHAHMAPNTQPTMLGDMYTTDHTQCAIVITE